MRLLTAALLFTGAAHAAVAAKAHSAAVAAKAHSAATVDIEPFGSKGVAATLTNDRGMSVSVIDYGARITAINVPDRNGQFRNVVLSLKDPDGYLTTKRRFAAVMGRYAGRIGGARYSLDGQEVRLVAGPRGAAIHGDPDGFDRRFWAMHSEADRRSVSVVLSLTSPDGDQGFPGQMQVSVTYRLMKASNLLAIEYRATIDKPAPINLTNHAFFNLAGAGTAGIAGHLFQIDADRMLEADEALIPTGKILPVAGSKFDFRRPVPPVEADNSLLFRHKGTVARFEDPASGRVMVVRTTEPSVQLFTGNGFDGSEMGGEGRAYQRGDGFAFETQHYPDSPNHANFPSTILKPGQTFRSETDFVFTVSRR